MALKQLRSSKKHGNNTEKKNEKKEQQAIEITTVSELEDYFNDVNFNFRKKKKSKTNNDGESDDIDYDLLLKSLIVKGDTQKLGSKPTSTSSSYFFHSVQKILHYRRQHYKKKATTSNYNSNSTFTSTSPLSSTKPDNHKVALVIEGGGMRGCVTAGMVTAIYYLGLEDTFDVIYGSSAGTIIGAYFNTRQLPWFGPEVYYDSLTTANKDFIDTKRLLRCIGVGLLDPRLVKDVLLRPKYGKPVLNLDFLLCETMQINKPLNWTKFVEHSAFQQI